MLAKGGEILLVRSFLACLSMSRLPFRIIAHLARIYGVPDKLREFVGCCFASASQTTVVHFACIFAGAFPSPHHALRTHS